MIERKQFQQTLVRVVLLGLALLFPLRVMASPSSAQASLSAVFTYYDLPGLMASGNYVHPGAAACASRYMGWTVHVVEPDVWLVCEDTGAAWWFEQGDIRIDVWSQGRPWWMTGAGAQVWEIEMWP